MEVEIPLNVTDSRSERGTRRRSRVRPSTDTVWQFLVSVHRCECRSEGLPPILE
jgi:hypothetical protein